MSWVLILNSSLNAKPPAVIGGYPDREKAERAGELATAISHEKPYAAPPYYSSYLVIPGAACSGPVGSTYSYIDRSADYTTWERFTKRYPEDKSGAVALEQALAALREVDELWAHDAALGFDEEMKPPSPVGIVWEKVKKAMVR